MTSSVFHGFCHQQRLFAVVLFYMIRGRPTLKDGVVERLSYSMEGWGSQTNFGDWRVLDVGLFVTSETLKAMKLRNSKGVGY